MRCLRDRGYEIVCIAPPDERTEELVHEGFRFIPLNLQRSATNPIKDFFVIRDLYKIYRKEKFDAVFHYTVKINIYGSLAAKMAGTPSFDVIPGLGYVFSKKCFLSAFVNILYKIALFFPRKVIFLNADDQKEFFTKKLISPDQALLMHSEGVNTEYYAPLDKREQKETGRVFLFLGRCLEDKGLEKLVEAFKQVRRHHSDAELWLLGKIDRGNPRGITEDKMRSWERNSGVKYLGETKDVRPFISQSDVCVYPSYYREGVPRGLLEAMSMSKPIITTDSVGCRDVIEDEKNGFMVQPRDVDSLTRAMMRMVELPEKDRVEMGRYGRKKALLEFDENKIIDIYLKLIRDLENNASNVASAQHQIHFKSHDFTSNEIAQVASLHQHCLEASFLSSLGLAFLRKLYTAIGNDPSGVLMIAVHDDKVIGFVSGTVRIKAIYDRLIKKDFFNLSAILFPKIFSLRTLFKIFELFLYSHKNKRAQAESVAELLSIAVNSEYRGQGVAQSLFHRLNEEFQRRNVPSFKIIVGANLLSAQKFYKKMGACHQETIELHRGEKSFVYRYQSLIN